MTAPHPTAEKAGLYLRRGTRVTPGVMTLDAGILSFATATTLEFQPPVAEITGEFTTFSTLVLTVHGAKYVFVHGGYAGAFAPSFSAAQIAEIGGGAFSGEHAQRAQRGAAILGGAALAGAVGQILGNAVFRVAGIGGSAIGVAKIAGAQHASFQVAKAWAQYLADNGVTMRMRGTTFARSQLVVASILLPILVAVGFAAWGIASAISAAS